MHAGIGYKWVGSAVHGLCAKTPLGVLVPYVSLIGAKLGSYTMVRRTQWSEGHAKPKLQLNTN
jgi:hypothetical protein